MLDKGGGKTPPMVVELLTKAVAEKSQSAVARETGLTLLTVQRYLKGIGEPRDKNLKRLSDYFGVSVAVLRGDGFASEKILFEATGLEFSEDVTVFEKYAYYMQTQFKWAFDEKDTFFSGNIHFLHNMAEKARDLLKLPESFYRNIHPGVWDTLKSDAQKVIDKYQKVLETADEETRACLLSIDLHRLTEENNFYDLTTASDYYARLTSTFDIIFGLSLTSKHAHENKLFLSVAVSLAKLVRDMPQEFKDIYDADYINELSNIARDVIKKFSADKLLEKFKQPTAAPRLRNKKSDQKQEK